jgi:peptide/nickel transport system permease protein
MKTGAVAVLSEAGLSFLGYGAPPSTPSWGRLLSDLQNYVTLYPLTVVWPGLAITVTVLGFNLFGDGLREATDPRLRTGRGGRRTAARQELPR